MILRIGKERFDIRLTDHSRAQFAKRFYDMVSISIDPEKTLLSVLRACNVVRRDGRWLVVNGTFEGVLRKVEDKYVLLTVVRRLSN